MTDRVILAASAFPEWAEELHSWLAVSPQVVIAGNINDLHLVGGAHPHASAGLRGTADVVRHCLLRSGYQVIFRWNAVAGLDVLHPPGPQGELAAFDIAGADLWETRAQPTADDLARLLQAVTRHERVRSAVVVENAPRLAASPNDFELHRVYAVAQHLAQTAPRRRLPTDSRGGLHNAIVWLVEREADLPHWLVGAGPVRVVSVPVPSIRERGTLSRISAPVLPGYDKLTGTDQEDVIARLAAFTDGMSLKQMAGAIQLAMDRPIPADRIEEAVRFVRSARRASPWHDVELRERIAGAADALNEAVLGQRRAVRKVADVLARAALGLSGAQSASQPTRPQGVLFLAGPTGVGKTELAKKVAEIVFGRADAMIRFDMSEFAAEHSEARLLGAPPGYIGHDAGGELTNAVRRRPFSLLLFDEIEKANPRILDKFLQILEDGRLTDAAGVTVHFGDTLIVFTSNLGTTARSDARKTPPAVRPGAGHDEVDSRVRAAIRRDFLAIGKPELLNRIGDNIVVFDFIEPDVARKILRRSLHNVTRQVERQTGNRVRFADRAVTALEELVVQPDSLAFGGRAVGSIVESRVLNPLARRLLTMASGSYEISAIDEGPDGARLELAPA